MVTPNNYPASFLAEKLLRAVNRKMSEYLLLTLSIQSTEGSDILRGIATSTNIAMSGITIHFIADPRVFHVKVVIAKNVDNFWEKHMLAKRSCHRCLVSYREMTNCVTNGDVELLAQDIVREISDLLQAIFRMDFNQTKP